VPPTESFGWLHLTDLHYGLAGQSPLWPNVREAFFADLRKVHGRSGPWQAVLFTGDLVQAGKEEEFKAIEAEVLGRLWKELAALGSGDAVLLAVPGNHDLARPDSQKPSPAARWLLCEGGFAEIEEEFWGEPDGDYRRVINAAFANYAVWWERTARRPGAAVVPGILAGDFAATLAVGSRALGVVGLNTTFLQLAGGDYQGRLAWDLRQLQAACGGDAVDWCARHDACLLLTHQGRDWFDPRSQESYPELNPAGRFAAHLFGHMHEAMVRSMSHGGGKPLREWQGCSLFGLEKYGEPPKADRRHGYGAGRIDFGGRHARMRLFPRRAVRNADGWRFVPDQESCVLLDDGGTAPEPLASVKAARRSPRQTAAHPSRMSGDGGEAVLIAAFTRAARSAWDIIDLTGLPEDQRQLAMQHFLLRQLYVPLRMREVRAADEGTVAALEEHRDRQRLTVAGRDDDAVKKPAGERRSLGDFLRSALADEPPGAGRTEAGQSHAPRLVILGDPGGGKTTLLRWLATACLLRLAGDPDLARLPDAGSLPEIKWLPILVRCRELDRTHLGNFNLGDLLRQAAARMELPGISSEALVALLRARLESGLAILLVDGLDEITDPGLRAAFCGCIESIASGVRQAPILATSRIVGYREMHRRLGRGFAHATLAELAPEEKEDFVRRWCEVTIHDPARRANEVERLRRAIQGSDRIGRLTTNPMLLTTMALVQRRVGKLPNRRHKLYWEAVNVLLNWRPEVEEPMDADEALPQLEYLAYTMCDRGVQRLRRDEVMLVLEQMRRDYPNIRPVQRQSPEGFLAQVERRTGLFVEVGEVARDGKPMPVYEFRHLTFQEYLAALAILAGRFPGHRPGTTLAERVRPLAGTLAEHSSIHGMKELLVTESWRETLRLCIASCNDEDVDAALTAIVRPDRPEEARPRAILALLCLCDEPNVTQEGAGEILRRFAEHVAERDGNSGSPAERAVIESLGSTWAEQLKRVLAEEFLRRDWHSRWSPGSLCGVIGSRKVQDGDETIRSTWIDAQIEALAAASDLEAVTAALAVMVAAYDGSERGRGLHGLVNRLTVLLGRGPAIAHSAAWALGWLIKPWSAQSAASRSVRRRVAKQRDALIAYLSSNSADPEALRWVLKVVGVSRIQGAVSACEKLLRHSEHTVRSAAIEALGLLGAVAIASLKKALRVQDVEVRDGAVTALARIGGAAAVKSLQEALGHKDARVRRVAAEALGQVGGPVAVKSLQQALGDRDARVRTAVAEALGQVGGPAAVKCLQLALRDPDDSVRRASVLSLATLATRKIDIVLLSQDFDGTFPGFDPREVVSQSRVEEASRRLSWNPAKARKRYEDLALQYGLALEWQTGSSSAD
jgi:hypothetical protein